ncbi:MAG TPA: tetratricopeptide repeat protein, partial [Streptosporangiaceae bacterium]|nr:tetratricopeptide repeat protein [Streptosporangiaceae bacterium]
LASELRDARGSLNAFGGGEAAADPRVVFSWSYQQLSPQAARLFRLLGLHPGPDTTARAAASLAALPAGQARGSLAELARANLITEHTPGRFTFHDLLRAYAREQAHAKDSQDDRNAAVSRVLDHYLHTANAACLRLHPRVRSLTLAPPPPGVLPEEHPDSAAAWAWFDAEHPVLFAAVDLAAATRWDTHVWQLAWTLMEFVDRQGRWHDWAAMQHTALSAARRRDDRYGQVHAHAGMAMACRWLGRDNEACSHLQQALDLCVALGDAAGQAGVHILLGRVCEYKGRLAAALRHDQEALTLSRAAGDRRSLATALNNAGWHHSLLGDHHQALDHCEKALALFREVGDHRGEAYTLDSLGYAHYHLGNYEKSVSCYQQSVVRHQEVHSGYHMAMVLGHLGDALDATSDEPAARTAWQQALAILDHLSAVLPHGASPGYPDPGQIHAKLARQEE